MDAINGLARKVDIYHLLTAHLAVGLLGALGKSPSYNVPLYLFGLLVYNEQDTNMKKMQLFAAALASSLVLDIMWSIAHNSLGFSYLFTLINMVTKPVTVAITAQFLQNHGAVLPFTLREDYERMDNAERGTMPGNFA